MVLNKRSMDRISPRRSVAKVMSCLPRRRVRVVPLILFMASEPLISGTATPYAFPGRETTIAKSGCGNRVGQNRDDH